MIDIFKGYHSISLWSIINSEYECYAVHWVVYLKLIIPNSFRSVSTFEISCANYISTRSQKSLFNTWWKIGDTLQEFFSSQKERKQNPLHWLHCSFLVKSNIGLFLTCCIVLLVTLIFIGLCRRYKLRTTRNWFTFLWEECNCFHERGISFIMLHILSFLTMLKNANGNTCLSCNGYLI